MRRLRCLVIRGGPLALLNAAAANADGGGQLQGAAKAWQLSARVLRGLRGLFPHLVELDLGGGGCVFIYLFIYL